WFARFAVADTVGAAWALAHYSTPLSPVLRGEGSGVRGKAARGVPSPLTLPSPPGVPGGEGARDRLPSPPVLRGRGVGGEGEESSRHADPPHPCPSPPGVPGGEGDA